ncbi:MAG TPA: hypothetical protein VGI64_06015 [Streptosporangiaceae bacterium]|jgi:hypothetical protein
MTQLRPVTAILDPQQVPDLDGRRGQRVAGQVGDRRDQRAGTVAHGHRRAQVLPLQHGGCVPGDLGGQAEVGRIGQVVAERDPDPPPLAGDAQYDQTAARVEAKQVRYHGEHAIQGRDPDPAVPPG